MDRTGRKDSERRGPRDGGVPRRRRSRPAPPLAWGIAPFPLVETALSPLDFRPGVPLEHHARFEYHDRHRRRRDGTVTIRARDGLSPTDDLVLNGLLAITLADPAPVPELAATPDYLCRRLGLPVGGEHYARLRQSLLRLQRVTYRNDAWEDPRDCSRRAVDFRLFSLDFPFKLVLPSAGDPCSATEEWTILWDPFFFKAIGNNDWAFLFDFAAYRALKPPARRGYLLLLQRFHRDEQAPTFDLRRLAVDQLGYAADLGIKSIRQKIRPILRTWAGLGLIPGDVEVETFFTRRGPGDWSIRLPQGPKVGQLFAKGWPFLRIADHFAYGQLKKLGLSGKKIEEVLRDYRDRLAAVIRVERLARVAEKRDTAYARSKGEKFLHYLPRNEALPRWYEDRLRKRRRDARWLRPGESGQLRSYVDAREAAFEAWLKEPAVAKRNSDLIEALWGHEQWLHPGAKPEQAQLQAEDQARLRLDIEFPFPEFSEWLAG